MVIAIDGPAGAGKSTVARALAAKLGFTYLDTGAMYRCVGLLALESPEDEPAALAHGAEIVFAPAGTVDIALAAQPSKPIATVAPGAAAAGPLVLLDGCDVTTAIRAHEVSEVASRVAADPLVREALVRRQRALVAQGDWVAEGRDIASAVAPEAELKIFLTADPSERARRRAGELAGEPATIMAELALRDERDSTLGRSALAPAPGAVPVDTSGLTVEQVVDRIAEMAARASR
ncbi:MAG TPA: (d)CMP kinase [Solirubrobacteraceae bacterium]|jgi:cytidylate kinase|nr:(d)CMP kinase [Solirubrobacteraceae bacterium]